MMPRCAVVKDESLARWTMHNLNNVLVHLAIIGLSLSTYLVEENMPVMCVKFNFI